MPITEFPKRGPLLLPEKFEQFRPHQIDAVNEVLDLFKSGVKTVLLDAPTGAGKTLIGETVRILHPSNQGLYVCTTKTLQDQFIHDFPDAALIKGRSNYPTLDSPDKFKMGLNGSMCVLETRDGSPPGCGTCYSPRSRVPDSAYEERAFDAGAEVSWRHCTFCHPHQDCPYRSAKEEALEAPLAVANTAYFLYEANYAKRFSGRELVTIDEADTLESLLMSFMGVDLSKWKLTRAGVDQPKLKTVAASWIPWALKAIDRLGVYVNKLNYDVKQLEPGPPMYKLVKEREEFQNVRTSIERFKNEIEVDPDNWVFDEGTDGGISFKPVEVARFGPDVLWQHSRQFLLMSATLVSPKTMMSFLGHNESYAAVKVDSQFDPERRPVWVCPAANMTWKLKDAEWPKMADAVGAVLERHPDVRILVHTVSYDFTGYLHEVLRARHGHRLLSYSAASEREGVLEQFRAKPDGVVLAPSFDRGVDLPGDEARVIVVTKVPFPFLGDKQIAQRLHGTGLPGRTWYAMETVRSLVQMTGRGMRHEDDWCISYILDRQFGSNVYKKRELLPKWWLDALKWGPPTDGGAEAIERAPVPGRIE